MADMSFEARARRFAKAYLTRRAVRRRLFGRDASSKECKQVLQLLSIQDILSLLPDYMETVVRVVATLSSEKGQLKHLRQHIDQYDLDVSQAVGGSRCRTLHDMLADIDEEHETNFRDKRRYPARDVRHVRVFRDALNRTAPQRRISFESLNAGDGSLARLKAFARQENLHVKLNTGGYERRTLGDIYRDISIAYGARTAAAAP